MPARLKPYLSVCTEKPQMCLMPFLANHSNSRALQPVQTRDRQVHLQSVQLPDHKKKDSAFFFIVLQASYFPVMLACWIDNFEWAGDKIADFLAVQDKHWCRLNRGGSN